MKKRSKHRPRWTSTDRKLLKRERLRQLLEPKQLQRSKESYRISKMQWKDRWLRVTFKSEKRSSKKNRKPKESLKKKKRLSGLRCLKDFASKLVLKMSAFSSSKKPKKSRKKKRRSSEQLPLYSLKTKTKARVSVLSPTWLQFQSQQLSAIPLNKAQLRK